MKILVVGAGAVGGYYGAKLASCGHELYFLARGQTLEAINRSGVVVKSYKGDFTSRPAGAADKFETIPKLDLILVCVKRGDTESVLGTIAQQAGKDTVVVPLQNGADAENGLMASVPASRIIGGIAHVGAALTAPGCVNHTSNGIITLGEMDGSQSERVVALKKVFENCGIPCSVSTDIVKAKWEKLMWNAGFNGVCALTNQTVHGVLAHPPTADLVKTLMEELVAVAEKKGINVDRTLAAKYIESACKGGDTVPSTLQDFRHGKRTEIRYMNGKVCEEGRKADVATPCNDAIYALVSAHDLR
jgi:2-dehydropantoate 2-reductase